MRFTEFITESSKICPQCGMRGCTCKPGTCKCKPKPGYPKNIDEAANPAQQAAIAIAKKKKQGVAEQGYGNHPSQRVDPRTGKKYVPPKSPLGQGVAEEGKGLWANIHAKQNRIKKGSGEHMRKPGSKGAPTAQNFKDAASEGLNEFAPIKPPTAGAFGGNKDYGQPNSSRYIGGNKFVVGTTNNYVLTATIDKWGLEWDEDDEIWYLDSPGAAHIADATEGEIELPAPQEQRYQIHDLVTDYLNERNSADLQKVAAYYGHSDDGEMATNEGETWSKHNNPRAGGMSKKSVKSYRRSHPGSKIQTAVTTKPSKIKKGSKDAKRRKSFCARMRGMKKHNTSAKTKNDPNSNINKSLRRWHCESVEQMQELVMLAEQMLRKHKV